MDESQIWHKMDVATIAQRLEVTPSNGLSLSEAALRLSRVGLNQLAKQLPCSRWLLFLSQFKNILIIILISAAVLAALVGNVKDASVIIFVVLINAAIGFYQEYRAEESIAALKKMLPLQVYVRRDNKKLVINADHVVPGDVVLLGAGDRVPADGRLIEAMSLEIDESTLTGESQPVRKQAEALNCSEVSLSDRINMAYMNTMVTRGRAELLITATGMQTEMGSLSEMLATTPEKQSPLQEQLGKLGQKLGAVACVLVGILFVLQMFRGVSVLHAIFDSIALAVAAIPEGLPVVVTVTLALGMHQMAKQRAIVKRLSSVETLGCTTVICSDKTGTLTMNQMTARALFYRGQRFEVSGEGYDTSGLICPEKKQDLTPDLSELLIPLVACNDSSVSNGRPIGDPTEAALLVLAMKAGLDYKTVAIAQQRIAEIPFDSSHKFMATFHQQDEHIQLFVKGAPDELLGRCQQFLGMKEIMPLDEALRDSIIEEYRKLALRGMRGLLVASKQITQHDFAASDDIMSLVSELVFVGLVGLIDPPRPEAKQAIASCKKAGVLVKMITGDHQDTGMAIAQELGLTGRTITGLELDAIDEQQLSKVINDMVVFARVTPRHKMIIVKALQAKGHVVAMTGDGVNDAPALKASDIGLAMGVMGTDVAKDAASIVLTDDNFSTIVSAIKQGRRLYDNIVKFIRFQLSTTTGAMLTLFLAPIIGLPEPFNPIQILWVAMIMDGPPAVSLALDAARVGIMSEPPRRRTDAVLTWPRVGKIMAFGCTMMVGTLLVLYGALQTEPEKNALTLGFTTFVLFQFFNIFNARVEKGSVFSEGFFKNRMLWCSLVIGIGLQVLAVHWQPAQSIFETSDLSAAQWALAVGVASSILWLNEGQKAFSRWFL